MELQTVIEWKYGENRHFGLSRCLNWQFHLLIIYVKTPIPNQVMRQSFTSRFVITETGVNFEMLDYFHSILEQISDVPIFRLSSRHTFYNNIEM